MGRRNRTGAAPCHCKRQDIKCGFARKARSGQGKIDMAAATRSGLWILVWCFAAVHGYMPVEFYGGLLGRSLAGPGPPMPWEGRFKKRRRFGTSCRRVQGIDEDNVFPVAPQKKPWHLDKGRRRPVLRITRKQFPLAPGSATTAAHAVPGGWLSILRVLSCLSV